jgi:exosome complex component RRP42
MSSMKVSNLTRDALKKMFSEDKRFDGRKLLDFKDLNVQYGVSNKAEGSARVKLGKTDVVVGVKMQTGEPYPDSPDKGNLMVSADLLPLASPRFEQGPPKFPAIELPRLVDRAIRECGMIDFSKLVITEGENVWTVIVDIYPINDDGALIDAASIGAVAALRDAVFPVLKENGKVDFSNKTKDKLPLDKNINPLSITFYKLEDKLILHPTREEEEACETKVVWGLSKWNGQYMINSCQKGLETPFSKEEVAQMMKILPGKYDELMIKLKKFLK